MMAVSISSWALPVALTVVFLGIMFRPYQSRGDYDWGNLVRVLWVIAILLVWLIYFMILYFLR